VLVSFDAVELVNRKLPLEAMQGRSYARNHGEGINGSVHDQMMGKTINEVKLIGRCASQTIFPDIARYADDSAPARRRFAGDRDALSDRVLIWPAMPRHGAIDDCDGRGGVVLGEGPATHQRLPDDAEIFRGDEQ